MKNLEDLYGEFTMVRPSAFKYCYHEGIDHHDIVNSGDDNYLHLRFDIIDDDDEIKGSMFGYDIIFDDFEEVLISADDVSSDASDLTMNIRDYIIDDGTKCHIYLNMDVSEDMDYEAEAYLMVHLERMLQQFLDYTPEYIAGYVRKETYKLIENEMKAQGYVTVSSFDKYLQIFKNNYLSGLES